MPPKRKLFVCQICSQNEETDSIYCMNCFNGCHKTCEISAKPYLWDNVNFSFICKQCIYKCSTPKELYQHLLKLLRCSMANHKSNFILVAKNVEMILELYENIIPDFPDIQTTRFHYSVKDSTRFHCSVGF